MDYEGLLEAFYSRLPLNGSTVIDVGAHTGRHAIPLATLVGASGIVHAFEPIPEIRGQLAQNLESASVNNALSFTRSHSPASLRKCSSITSRTCRRNRVLKLGTLQQSDRSAEAT